MPNIPLLAGPVDYGELWATVNGIILAINDSGIGSAAIQLLDGPVATGSEVALVNGLALSINAVTAPDTVLLLRSAISGADLQGALNDIIRQTNAFDGGGSSYTGPLDIVPGAVVAYGQRALSAAKRGTALYTLREDAGDTTQSFNSDAVTGDAPVAAITAFLNGANGFVTMWNDQSENGTDASQATAVNQPGWIAAGPNAHPAIEGAAGAFSLLETSLGTGEINQWTSFHVIRYNGSDARRVLNASSLTTSAYIAAYIYADLSIDFDASDDSGTHEMYDITAAAAVSENVYHIIEYTAETGSLAIYIDGELQTLIGPFGDMVFGPLSNLILGIDVLASNVSLTRVEDIGYPLILSGPDRLAIRQNIASCYGITLA